MRRAEIGDGPLCERIGLPHSIPTERTAADGVVELTLPDDTVVKRLLGRGRSDDTEEVIRRRQQVYRDDTAPLLDFYRRRLVSVNAVGTVAEITDRLLSTLQTTVTSTVGPGGNERRSAAGTAARTAV